MRKALVFGVLVFALTGCTTLSNVKRMNRMFAFVEAVVYDMDLANSAQRPAARNICGQEGDNADLIHVIRVMGWKADVTRTTVGLKSGEICYHYVYLPKPEELYIPKQEAP